MPMKLLDFVLQSLPSLFLVPLERAGLSKTEKDPAGQKAILAKPLSSCNGEEHRKSSVILSRGQSGQDTVSHQLIHSPTTTTCQEAGVGRKVGEDVTAITSPAVRFLLSPIFPLLPLLSPLHSHHSFLHK